MMIMNKVLILGLLILVFRILTLIVFSGDLMGSIVGIVCGAGLVFVITGKISFLRT